MIIDQLTPTVSDNLTDEVPVEQGTATFKTTWQKILNLFKGNITASDISSTDGNVQNDIDDLQTDVGNKQDTLVSGTNIKTIGNTSLLGSGNIAFPVTSVNTKTGAVTLDADDVGAMSKWDLLWTNTEPTSGFNAQTIPLDLSKYDLVMVIYRLWTNNDYCQNIIVGVGMNGMMTISDTKLDYRRFTTTSTGITFETGYVTNTYGQAATASPNGIIPVKIYGIK